MLRISALVGFQCRAAGRHQGGLGRHRSRRDAASSGCATPREGKQNPPRVRLRCRAVHDSWLNHLCPSTLISPPEFRDRTPGRSRGVRGGAHREGLRGLSHIGGSQAVSVSRRYSAVLRDRTLRSRLPLGGVVHVGVRCILVHRHLSQAGLAGLDGSVQAPTLQRSDLRLHSC